MQTAQWDSAHINVNKNLRVILPIHPWKCNPSLDPRVSTAAARTQGRQRAHSRTAPPHAKGKSSHTTQINMSTARHCYPKVLSRFSPQNHHTTLMITQTAQLNTETLDYFAISLAFKSRSRRFRQKYAQILQCRFGDCSPRPVPEANGAAILNLTTQLHSRASSGRLWN